MSNSPIYAEVQRALREAEKQKQRTNGYTVHLIDCATREGYCCTCAEIRGILDNNAPHQE